MLRQASQAVSKLKHPDKYKLVKMCIQKEKEGFECTVPRYKYRRILASYLYNEI